MERSFKLVSRTGEPALSHWAFAAQAMRMKTLREWILPVVLSSDLDPVYLISPYRGSFPFVSLPRLERPGGFGARLLLPTIFIAVFFGSTIAL